ncbi:porin family protein [Tenacibaculum ovolyticum]|uniref:porin family protein n=1 Tax=Tenacibaculum ovolyticum TaxID=104270 RepID=UPI001F1FEEAF|nr:porin family protein [Tenacibaculum ovolyticum]
MKKTLLLTLITAFGFVNMNAQNIEFGVKGGLNFADIRSNNANNAKTVTAFNFGAMAEISITDKFSFQPELIFSGRGFSIGDDVTALNYLSLPLIAKYYATERFSLEVGPQIGYLLSAEKESTDIKSNFKDVDFGVNMGIGYKLDSGLNFGARYNLGLSNINNIDNATDKIKSGVLQLSVGYFF